MHIINKFNLRKTRGGEKALKRNKFMVIMVLSFLLLMVLNPMTAHAKGTDSGVFDKDVFDVEYGPDGMIVSGQDSSDSAWQTLLSKYKNFITGIAAVGAVTMVVLFIIQFMKLGASAGNPQARSHAITGIIVTGIAAAGLGAAALITGIFYKAI